MSTLAKWIIGIGILIAITAIGTPIYFYVKDFNGLPRSSNPSDWGTFGDFFGGVLNSFISLLTLIVTIIIAIHIGRIEKRNHNEMVHSPVKPLFTIETGQFFSSNISATGPTIDKEFYMYNKPQSPAGPNEYLSNQFYLKVSNKGLGVADQVKVTFTIDLEELKKSIDLDYPQINIITTDIISDEYVQNYIILKSKPKIPTGPVYQSKIREIESYGLGVVNKEEEVNVVFPNSIMDAFRIFNFLRRIADFDTDFPPINVKLNYRNIHSRNLVSQFKIRLVHVHNYTSYSVFRISQEQI